MTMQLDGIADLCGHAREKLNAKLEETRRQIAQLDDLRSDIRGMVDSGDMAGDGCWPGGSRLPIIEVRTRS